MKLLRSCAVLLVVMVFITIALGMVTIPPAIPNTKVQDHANLLSEEQRSELQAQLQSFVDKYNTEVGVAIVNTLNDQDIKDYTREMARQYGIGSKDNEKRGILLLVAINDRKWRVEISRHVEPFLTDADSSKLARNYLVPSFKQGKYAEGIGLFVSALDEHLKKHSEPEQKEATVVAPTPNNGFNGGLLALISVLGLGAFGIIFALYRRLTKEEEPDTTWNIPYEPTPVTRRYTPKPVYSKPIQRDDDEDNEPVRRSSYSSPSYSPPSSSGSSSSSSSSSSSDSGSFGGFGGGGDFGGGGSDGSW